MKFAFFTLGCKVNLFETQALSQLAAERGHEIVDSGADAVIINTCTVTSVSDHKNIRAFHRLRRDNPRAVIAACGCFAQTDPERVRAVIAGGYGAMFAAVEGAEDDRSLGANDLKALHLTEDDSVVGIAASGRTPYVLGALDYAKSVGALTIAVTCCPGCEAEAHADIAISPAPGPEVITGSTRMKSGTAQKMILNMLSTGVMVKLGKVYGNLMVDVKASNEKLRERCVRIVRQATGAEDAAARAALIETNYACKPAIVMLLLGVDKTGAETLLTRANGRVAAALEG